MDLYEELIEEKEADSNATKAENASLKAEVAKLKEDNKNLWIINTDLSEKLKRASTNITALIKTCRAELNRYVFFFKFSCDYYGSNVQNDVKNELCSCKFWITSIGTWHTYVYRLFHFQEKSYNYQLTK